MDRFEGDLTTRPWWSDLVDEVTSFPLTRIADGSGSSHMDGPEGWIHGLSMSRVGLTPYIGLAIGEITRELASPKLVQIMVNKLEGGARLDQHKDGLPFNLRFHLPIITHELVTWWDERDGSVHMDVGHWHGPVPYCGVLHAMYNESTVDRYHLIVDFEGVKS